MSHLQLFTRLFFAFVHVNTADHNGGLPGEDYEESGEDDYDDDEDDDDHIDRKPFPFFTPVTPYPPVYRTYVILI